MYILPNNFSCSLYVTGLLEFETKLVPAGPAPAPLPACTAPGDENGVVSAGPAPAPATRLVIKGLRWVECPVWSSRQNPLWEQMVQGHQEEDEQRLRRRAHKAPAPPPPGTDTQASPTGTDRPAPPAALD